MTQTRTSTAAIDECVSAVDGTFRLVFAHIESWRDAIQARADDTSDPLASESIDDLVEHLVLAELSAPRALIVGAGFVATPGYLADTDWHLAWWLGHANTFGVGSAEPTVRRLEAEEDASADSFRDYTALEWWRVPASTGAAHITGPYVDYLCTDEYTLTLTMPVYRGDSMIGVVGADLYVEDIERTLLPRIRAIGARATVVNASRRVMVSTDPHRPTGSILRPTDSETTVPCGETSLLLVLE